MQWFYAIDGERLGPVSPEELAVLVAHGTVAPTTLVWREGFANWQAWSEVEAQNPLPEVSDDAPAPDPVPLAAGPAEAGPEIDWSVDEFTDNLRTNGFATSVGGCLTRAWENYKSFFGLALGAVFVAYLLAMVAGLLPVIGMLSGILISPHINAGASWIFLKRARGEEVAFADVFAGFSRCYGKLAMVGLIQFGVMLAAIFAFMVPMMLLGVSMEGMENGNPPDISGAHAHPGRDHDLFFSPFFIRRHCGDRSCRFGDQRLPVELADHQRSFLDRLWLDAGDDVARHCGHAGSPDRADFCGPPLRGSGRPGLSRCL